jgi:hypothetical protein
VVYAPSSDDFFGRMISPADAVLRGYGEVSRLSIGLPTQPALPWLTGYKQLATDKRITDSTRTALAAGADSVRSDTGELERDWGRRVTTVNTPRLQAAMGELGGKDVRLADVQFRLTNQLATAVAISLDDKALAQSDDWLLVIVARAQPQEGRPTYLMEPAQGIVQFRLSRTVTASIVGSDGASAQGDLVPDPHQQGWLALDMGTFKGRGAIAMRIRNKLTTNSIGVR